MTFEHKKFIGLNNDIIKIRTVVFMDEQGFKEEFDETDKTCSHIVLYDNKKPIATCRYFKEGKNYHIGRVAIIKEYRGQHLGNKIMKLAEDEIKKEGGQNIELSAQVRISDFYKKLGYNKVGDIYYDEFCEHIRMVKNL
ncbi:GNAT family N-acetyltransferase [bacterium]|nr:GNAT family N-acetyltransferase [bacterium]